MFYSFGIFGSPQFADHKTDISTIFISDKVVDNEKIINYRIDNKSDVTWNDVSFNVTGYDKDGSLVMSKSEHEYKWFLAARGSNVLTVKVSKDPQIVKWTLEISSLVKNRF